MGSSGPQTLTWEKRISEVPWAQVSMEREGSNLKPGVCCGPSGAPLPSSPTPTTLGRDLWTRPGAGLGADPLPGMYPSILGFHLFEGPCSLGCLLLGLPQSLQRPVQGTQSSSALRLADGVLPPVPPVPPGARGACSPSAASAGGAPESLRRCEELVRPTLQTN